MKKAINLLYTIVIPVIPLGLHMFIDLLTNVSTKLKDIYPELFFATISISIESFKALQVELKYNDTKQLFVFVNSMLSIISSVSYGSILVMNNLKNSSINIEVALLSSLIIFSSSIFVHIAIIVLKEA